MAASIFLGLAFSGLHAELAVPLRTLRGPCREYKSAL
jgi:hypothetical protein